MANITNIKLDSLLIVLINLSILIAVVSIIALIAANYTSNAPSLRSRYIGNVRILVFLGAFVKA